MYFISDFQKNADFGLNFNTFKKVSDRLTKLNSEDQKIIGDLSIGELPSREQVKSLGKQFAKNPVSGIKRSVDRDLTAMRGLRDVTENPNLTKPKIAGKLGKKLGKSLLDQAKKRPEFVQTMETNVPGLASTALARQQLGVTDPVSGTAFDMIGLTAGRRASRDATETLTEMKKMKDEGDTRSPIRKLKDAAKRAKDKQIANREKQLEDFNEDMGGSAIANTGAEKMPFELPVGTGIPAASYFNPAVKKTVTDLQTDKIGIKDTPKEFGKNLNEQNKKIINRIKDVKEASKPENIKKGIDKVEDKTRNSYRNFVKNNYKKGLENSVKNNYKKGLENSVKNNNKNKIKK